jgi:transcriptional regulator with XRE-family HTH domain
VTDRYSIGKRLKEYITTKKLKQKTVAQRINVTPGFISQIVNGEDDITSRVIAGLVKNFADLNIDWLLRGEGEMFLGKKENVVEAVDGMLAGVMEPELLAYEQGTGEGRLEYLERMVHALAKQNNELLKGLLEQKEAEKDLLRQHKALLEKQIEQKEAENDLLRQHRELLLQLEAERERGVTREARIGILERQLELVMEEMKKK